MPADDLGIPSLEPPCASTKSKETKEVGLGLDDPSKTMKIGAHLVSFLRANVDVFAWKPTDMPGVPWEKIEHSLNVSPTTKLIKQKLLRFALDKEAIRVEIKWLLATRFFKEVYHPEWLANPVLVHKKNKEWGLRSRPLYAVY